MQNGVYNNYYMQEKAKEILVTIFSHVGVKADYDISESGIEISSDDANLLIGYHGETLSSLQHFLNIMLYKEFGGKKDRMVILDVSGYRQDREKKLLEMAESASSKARFLNKSVALYPMNSYERRIVHTKVSEIDGVTSESEGEGPDRRVIIHPRSEE